MLVEKLKQDGTIIDKNNMMVGKVEFGGTVRDRNKMTIGYAKDIPVKQTAVFFFFNMFDR